MASENIIIKHSAGLHARPASLFVQTAQNYQSDVKVTFNGKTINGKSILGILSLGVIQGSEITINASGDDETEVIQALSLLVANNFEE